MVLEKERDHIKISPMSLRTVFQSHNNYTYL